VVRVWKFIVVVEDAKPRIRGGQVADRGYDVGSEGLRFYWVSFCKITRLAFLFF